MRHLHSVFFLAFAAFGTRHASRAFTREPPGRDPASIDKIRAAEEAVALTADNFDALTRGKLVFVKFYSPHCPHCQSMAKAWNKLATHYRERPGAEDILIGSVDCTDARGRGKDLCLRFRINGIPTLLHGDASLGGVYLKEYGGEKGADALAAFAAEALVPTCNPGNLANCSPAERAEAEKFLAMPHAELDEYIEGKEREVEDLRDAFKRAKADMQRDYDRKLMEKELRVTRARASMKLIREVAATKK